MINKLDNHLQRIFAGFVAGTVPRVAITYPKI